MKTLIFATALAMMLSISTQASNEGETAAIKTKVHIFQTNSESVDVYVAKTPGETVKIYICSESGTPLISTRIKKQSTRYMRYHLNALPEGNYLVKVNQGDEVISQMELKK